MKKNLSFGIVFLLTFLLVALPVYAISSDFLQRASNSYQRYCTKKNVPQPFVISCYLYDKVHELEEDLVDVKQKQSNQSNAISNLQASNSANLAEINALKAKRILAYGQYRGAGFTTTSNTDVPTDAKVEITCPISCLLFINYVVDTRNNQVGAHNFYQIYLDGTALSFQNQASYAFSGQAIPLALTAMYPVSPGTTHTVQIYAHPTAGQLEEHTKTLTVLAIGQ